jgi:hypothetical protein
MSLYLRELFMRHSSFLMSVAFVGAVLFAGGGFANPVPLSLTQQQAGPSVSALIKVLKIDDVIAVMQQEGLKYGKDMEAELFPEAGGATWTQGVALIYDGATMRARFEAAFSNQFAGAEAELPAIEGFFKTDLGQQILTLEVEARRSLMDEAVEDAAKARVEDMRAEEAPRMGALEAFSDANDLIEMNVMGAMNSNLAFLQGMGEVGALSEDMTQEDMLADVWGQEPDIRNETEGWIFPYLALAYGPLSDADFAAYLAFCETAAGQKLNAALFGAFDEVFSAISRDLGRAAARQMMGEDI